MEFNDEGEEHEAPEEKKNSLLSLQKINLKNYLNFSKPKKFTELSDSQNISHTHEQISILKQSDFLQQIDSTKNNDTKHFFINKDKIIEENDLGSIKSPLKMSDGVNSDENKEASRFDLKDILIQTNPSQSHILHSKDDEFKEDEEHLFKMTMKPQQKPKEEEEEEEEKSPPLNINDLKLNSDESPKKNEILLIGKESESMKQPGNDEISEDSVVLLPPVPANHNVSLASSVNSHNFDEGNNGNGVFLRKKFSVEKRKIGFSTITMRRDLSLFNNQDEKVPKSGESFGKMMSSGSDVNELDKNDRFPTNKKVMNELENIEKHIILKRNLENFIILFNSKPEDGIEYLIDHNMVPYFIEISYSSCSHRLGTMRRI